MATSDIREAAAKCVKGLAAGPAASPSDGVTTVFRVDRFGDAAGIRTFDRVPSVDQVRDICEALGWGAAVRPPTKTGGERP